MTWSIFLVAVHLLKGISRNLRESSTNNHNPEIPPYLKQGLDVNPLDYNDSISLRSCFSYPSHIGFCHQWLIPALQVEFLRWKRLGIFGYRRYESTYLLFHKRPPSWIKTYIGYSCCGRCIRRNTLCRMVLQLSLQWRSHPVAGLFGDPYWYCLSIALIYYPPRQFNKI